MKFTKMQGAGNDYVYVDCIRQSPPANPPQLARVIADRHYGVGGDGLILICPSEIADARMRMYNADGSESEMCGNGIRCVAKYVYDHGIARKPRLKIETGRGVLTLDVEVSGDRVQRVKVDMGEPILDAAKIPVAIPTLDAADRAINVRFGDFPVAGAPNWIDDGGIDMRATCVSMGNPHAVFYCQDVAAIPLTQVGPMLENHVVFPKRINVHFVQIHSPGEVTMRTWERGSGITLACGTGASAVCVSGVLTGKSARKILAHLPGGDLELEWSEKDNHVFMTGPAVEVFSGEWPT